ncbi:MAG TPA: TIM barrel protein [Pirellulaceae bacterium]|nr:TIM barrel protein [Pirellulaceae bacterium]
MQHVSRRTFLEASAAATALALTSRTARAASGDKMAYGLVTYLWGQDWDLPTLIANCEKAGALGVELRTTHAHGVEPTLNDQQRVAVRDRFADSNVTLVGIGSNERYDDPDPAVVKKALAATKEFIQLSHDVGSTGVKVKPDRFHPNVPREKTIEQIGKSLNELGKYAEGFGQQIRLEVHGQCAELPTIRAIMEIADHRNVAVCWNSNPQDLLGEGLEHNLGLVRDRFGATCHVRELESPDYPYQQLIDLLVKSDYDGWILLESSSKPADKVAALAQQVALFRQMVKKAQG